MSDEILPAFDLAIIEAHKRSRFDPLRHFDPHKLTEAMDSFRVGRLSELALAMDAMEERDDVLACVAPKAKSAVARNGWDIIVGELSDPKEKALAEKQKLALRYFYDQLRVTSALDQDECGGVSLLLRQMMDAKGKRYSIHNIVWKPGKNGLYSAVLWHVPLWFFENTTGKMRFISNSYGWDGEVMEPGSWLVTKGLGIGIASAVAWTYKHMSLRDWAIYSARHGMPGIEGITDAQRGSEAWNAMVKAVADAAAEFAWVRNRTEEIKPIQFGATGELPYPALVERMDRAMSALWRGADLGTISAGSGQGQGASLQGDEAKLMEQDDAQWLTETLNLKVDRLVLDYVFGPDVPALAYFKVLGANKQNVDQDLKIDEFAIKSGHPISQRQFADRYNRPIPDETDELLEAAAPAVPPVPGTGMPPVAAQNEAGAVGRDAIFMAAAAEEDLRVKREIFRDLAARIAEVNAATDPKERQALVEKLRADSARLYRDAIRGIPALAGAAERMIGSALVDGAVAHAQELKPTTSRP